MKKTVKCALLVSLVAFLSAAVLEAEISFTNPDINTKSSVLFTVKASVPGKGSYDTLFLKDIATGKLEQLTFYPEAMESLSGGSVLQIRSRFGTGRYDTRSDSFAWIDDYRPFYSGGLAGFGSLAPVAPSPDGRWQISIESVSAARGRLVIYDTVKSLRFIIADSVDRGAVPVTWSPDSSVLVYAVKGILYFARPESFFSVSAVDAQYRTLGAGTVNAVSWYAPGRFLYVTGTSVYRVQASELFARSLYSPLIGVGELAGKLPCPFNPSEDTFAGSPDGSSVLYAKDGRNVYYCTLSGDDYSSQTRPALLPYLLLPGNTARVQPAWIKDGIPTVFAYSVEDGKKTVKAWKLVELPAGKIFSPLDIPPGTSDVSVSKSGALVAFKAASSLSVYDTVTWKESASYRDERVVSACWADEPNLFVGGADTVRKWNSSTGSSSMLLIAAAASSGWDEQGEAVIAETGRGTRYSFAGNMRWVPSLARSIRPAASGNASWRIYPDSSAGYFANMLFVRSATTPGGTVPLIREPDKKLDRPADYASRADASVPGTGTFSHGSRAAARVVALTFDAMDSLDGLPVILETLERYKIRATFFINGEFIRQHPAAVNEIVKAGHQTASLFFTTWDLSGTKYRIDGDFIVRGLSRNEDDFYNATGQELTLLWHAPYYVDSPMIDEAGEKAGYRYVASDVSVLDWVTAENNRSLPGLCKDSATIIEDILAAKKPGSIIPVRIGKSEGSRPDYLYNKIEVLINALIEDGYDIVSVDELIKNAR